MRDIAERLATARDATTVGAALAEHAARAIGYDSFSFVPFDHAFVDPAAIVVRSSEFPPNVLRDGLVSAIVTVERELDGFAKIAASGPRSFDLADLFPRARIERTAVFRDFWAPFKLDHQLVSFMGSGAEPLGFFCIARSSHGRAFPGSRLRIMEELRRRAERSLSELRCFGRGDLASTLDALTRAFPSPAYLFDADGRLRWMSDDGALRLAVQSARVGSSRVCVRGNGALEALTSFVRALARGAPSREERSLRNDGVLRRDERLVVRRFGTSTRPWLLVAFEAPAISTHGGTVPFTRPAAQGLGPVASRVASLAAEGWAVLNIASVLGVSESTVRTHLRRVYVKLGVHNRAELACALLR